MSVFGYLVLAGIAAAYILCFEREKRAQGRGGYGERPQEAHDYFAGTTCHCYTDGTRVWFDKHGNLIDFQS